MSLLVNEEDVRRFYREFMLPYKKPRLLQCVARNKYADGKLSRGLVLLDRSIQYLDGPKAEDSFIRKLKRLDTVAQAGLYTDPKDDSPIGIASLVIYLSAYPLDEDDASDAFISHILERRKEHRKALMNHNVSDLTEPIMANTVSKLTTCLHKHPCRQNRMLKLDIDTKCPSLLSQLYQAMKDCRIIVAVETRGGYHVVIERGPSCQALWKFARDVNSKLKHEDQWITIEDNDGPMIAIPGTNQGGFTVQLATEEWKRALCLQKDSEPSE